MALTRDTTAAAAVVQREILRQLGGPVRLEMACRMSDDARDVALAGIRHRHPGWTPDAVHRELLRLMLGPDLAAAALALTPARR